MRTRALPLLLMLMAGDLFAQSHREQVTVNVVEVPVYLEPMWGRPIAGLTKEDFELFVNGKPQPIEYFDVLDEKSAPAETVKAEALHRRRLVVFLIHAANMLPIDVRRTQSSANRFIDSAPPGDTFAVAILRQSGVHFLVPFTTDRVAARRAIDTLSPSIARDPFQLAIAASERLAWDRSAGAADATAGSARDIWRGVSGVRFSGSRAAMDNTALVMQQRFENQQASLQSYRLIDHLIDLADRLAPLDGVKHVVLMSNGWHSDEENLNLFLRNASRMHEHYKKAGVILDALDVEGPKAPWPGARTIHGAIGISSSLYTLALATGGVVGSSIGRLQNLHSVTYVLSFRPSGPQKKTNDIRVRVKNIPFGTIVRHRPSYSLEGPATSKEMDGLFLADVLMNDIPQNGMSVALDVKQDGKVDVTASVPGVELLARSTDKPVVLDVFFYIFNDRKLISGWSQARIAIDLQKGREFLEANPYTIHKEFELAPGKYSAKALVRVVGTDIVGFQRASFDVAEN